MAVGLRALAGLGALSAALAFSGDVAWAQTSPIDWSVNATVTAIDASSSPGFINFQLSASAGGCAAGTWLVYNPGGTDAASATANAQQFLALLQNSSSNSVNVTVTGFNAGCVVQTVSMRQ